MDTSLLKRLSETQKAEVLHCALIMRFTCVFPPLSAEEEHIHHILQLSEGVAAEEDRRTRAATAPSH